MRIRFLEAAQREVDDAERSMTSTRKNLSRDELDRVIRRVKSFPLASTEIEPGIRRCLLVRFPYALIYGIDEELIIVVAVSHLHRQPRSWIDRL